MLKTKNLKLERSNESGDELYNVVRDDAYYKICVAYVLFIF